MTAAEDHAERGIKECASLSPVAGDTANTTATTADLRLSQPSCPSSALSSFVHALDVLFERYHRFSTLLSQCTYVVGPMVGISDLAFRLLCRKYGACVCYTEMFDSCLFVSSVEYRTAMLQTSTQDRPLVVQFAANDADILTQAALAVQTECDGQQQIAIAQRYTYFLSHVSPHYVLFSACRCCSAVCLNLGCPQRYARRHRLGAYLCEEDQRSRHHLLQMVYSLTSNPAFVLPLFAKIRLLSCFSATLLLCQQLALAGVSLIAIHGRPRGRVEQRRDGAADLEQIRLIVKAMHGFPVIILTNGNVRCRADIHRNLSYTQAQGIMVAESIMDNPALFSSSTDIGTDAEQPLPPMHTRRIYFAKEYLALLRQHPLSPCLAVYHRTALPLTHLTLFIGTLLQYFQLDRELAAAQSVDDMMNTIQILEQRMQEELTGRWTVDARLSVSLAQERERRQRIEDRNKTLMRQKHVMSCSVSVPVAVSLLPLTGKQRKHQRYKQRKLEKRQRLAEAQATNITS